jgi:hypothetical protein
MMTLKDANDWKKAEANCALGYKKIQLALRKGGERRSKNRLHFKQRPKHHKYCMY